MKVPPRRPDVSPTKPRSRRFANASRKVSGGDAQLLRELGLWRELLTVGEQAQLNGLSDPHRDLVCSTGGCQRADQRSAFPGQPSPTSPLIVPDQQIRQPCCYFGAALVGLPVNSMSQATPVRDDESPPGITGLDPPARFWWATPRRGGTHAVFSAAASPNAYPNSDRGRHTRVRSACGSAVTETPNSAGQVAMGRWRRGWRAR